MPRSSGDSVATLPQISADGSTSTQALPQTSATENADEHAGAGSGTPLAQTAAAGGSTLEEADVSTSQSEPESTLADSILVAQAASAHGSTDPVADGSASHNGPESTADIGGTGAGSAAQQASRSKSVSLRDPASVVKAPALAVPRSLPVSAFGEGLEFLRLWTSGCIS